jgi:hypothetical protein
VGHVRLGKLPATRKWRDIVALLGDDHPSIPHLAYAVEDAADRSFPAALNDPGFIEALWLMLKIPQAATSRAFSNALAKLGIKISGEPTLAAMLAGFDRAVERARVRSYRASTDFSVLARNAAVSALRAVVHKRLPTLWIATAEDERTALIALGTTEGFGELAQQFFTQLLENHLHYYLDREIPRHIGRRSFAPSIPDTAYFDTAMRQHCRESTLIMRAFAKDWLGNNQFHLGKDITRDEARKFASYAFTKISDELAARGARQ